MCGADPLGCPCQRIAVRARSDSGWHFTNFSIKESSHNLFPCLLSFYSFCIARLCVKNAFILN